MKSFSKINSKFEKKGGNGEIDWKKERMRVMGVFFSALYFILSKIAFYFSRGKRIKLLERINKSMSVLINIYIIIFSKLLENSMFGKLHMLCSLNKKEDKERESSI